MKLYISNYGPTLMVGIKQEQGDEHDAAERMLNHFSNLGHFTSEDLYDGYAVIDEIKELDIALSVRLFLDARLAGMNEDDAEEFASLELPAFKERIVRFSNPPSQRKAPIYSVSDSNDPADQPFD